MYRYHQLHNISRWSFWPCWLQMRTFQTLCVWLFFPPLRFVNHIFKPSRGLLPPRPYHISWSICLSPSMKHVSQSHVPPRHYANSPPQATHTNRRRASAAMPILCQSRAADTENKEFHHFQLDVNLITHFLYQDTTTVGQDIKVPPRSLRSLSTLIIIQSLPLRTISIDTLPNPSPFPFSYIHFPLAYHGLPFIGRLR
jgi:hypothetical protein